MVSTIIGVRELKQHAPSLVRRAARGEQITITRYGRPLAVLGPAEPSPRIAAWERERAAFERLAVKAPARYRGRYLAIAGGRVVDTDQSHERLYQRVERKLGDRPFFIGCVRREEPVIQMPGFSLA